MSGSLYGGNPFRQAVSNRYGNALLYDPFRFSFGRDYYSPISGAGQGTVDGATDIPGTIDQPTDADIPGVTDIDTPEPFEPVDGLTTNPTPDATPEPTPEPAPEAAASTDPYSLWNSVFGSGKYGVDALSARGASALTNEELARAARSLGYEDLPTEAGADYDWAGLFGDFNVRNLDQGTSPFYGYRPGADASGALARLWYYINNPSSGRGTGVGGGEQGGQAAGGPSEAGDMSGSVSDGLSESGDVSGIYRKGGYTGAGRDGRVQRNRPAGIVHENEVVLRSEAVNKYGKNALLALNEGRVPASKVRRWAR